MAAVLTRQWPDSVFSPGTVPAINNFCSHALVYLYRLAASATLSISEVVLAFVLLMRVVSSLVVCSTVFANGVDIFTLCTA